MEFVLDVTLVKLPNQIPRAFFVRTPKHESDILGSFSKQSLMCQLRHVTCLVLQPPASKEGVDPRAAPAENVEEKVKAHALSLVNERDVWAGPESNEDHIQIFFLEIVLGPLRRRDCAVRIMCSSCPSSDVL